MKVTSFEDLIAWQKAKELTLEIYRVFKDCRDFGFRDQIQRAVLSVMNNIAEGFERHSNQEFKRFLFIAKGSCGEVRSMLTVAVEISYVSPNEYQKFTALACEVSKLLSGLIKSL